MIRAERPPRGRAGAAECAAFGTEMSQRSCSLSRSNNQAQTTCQKGERFQSDRSLQCNLFRRRKMSLMARKDLEQQRHTCDEYSTLRSLRDVRSAGLAPGSSFRRDRSWKPTSISGFSKSCKQAADGLGLVTRERAFEPLFQSISTRTSPSGRSRSQLASGHQGRPHSYCP